MLLPPARGRSLLGGRATLTTSFAALALASSLALSLGCSALTGSDAGSGSDAPTADVSTDQGAPDVPGAPVTCALLGSECGGNHACYPYPFDGNNPSGTMCGLQGTGTSGIPCATQLDCDAQSICISPGDSSAICLFRCDPNFSFCSVGEICAQLPKYPGVGVCRSL